MTACAGPGTAQAQHRSLLLLLRPFQSTAGGSESRARQGDRSGGRGSGGAGRPGRTNPTTQHFRRSTPGSNCPFLRTPPATTHGTRPLRSRTRQLPWCHESPTKERSFAPPCARRGRRVTSPTGRFPLTGVGASRSLALDLENHLAEVKSPTPSHVRPEAAAIRSELASIDRNVDTVRILGAKGHVPSIALAMSQQ